MTKIPSVEERVEEFMSQYAWGKFFTIELEQEVRENLFQALTAQREAGAREERERVLQALPKEIIVHEYMPSENTPVRKGWNDYRTAVIKALTQPPCQP